MAKEDSYGCATRKIIRQRCAPEEVEPGKHVYRCEKTVQTLRDCFGRHPEVIDSQTEITEHEMGESWNQGVHFSMEQNSNSSISDYSGSWDTDIMRGLDDVLGGFERMTGGIMGEVKRITEEADRITGGLFGFPLFPGEEREERDRHVPSFPVKDRERKVDEGEAGEMQDPLYSEFADKVRDV